MKHCYSQKIFRLKSAVENYSIEEKFRLNAKLEMEKIMLKVKNFLQNAQHNKSMQMEVNYESAFTRAVLHDLTELTNLLLIYAPSEDLKDAMIHANSIQLKRMSHDYNIKGKYIMIPKGDNFPFKFASILGNNSILQLLLEHSKPDKVEEMIHGDDDCAFRDAAYYGQLHTLKFLIELTPDHDQRSKMIHSDCDEAFRYSASAGNTAVVEYLLELAESEEIQKQMISVGSYAALRFSAEQGHLDVFNAIMNEVTEQKELDNVVATLTSLSNPEIAECGHTEILERIEGLKKLESNEALEQRNNRTANIIISNLHEMGEEYLQNLNHCDFSKSLLEDYHALKITKFYLGGNLPELKYLDFYGNKITEFSYEYFAKAMDKDEVENFAVSFIKHSLDLGIKATKSVLHKFIQHSANKGINTENVVIDKGALEYIRDIAVISKNFIIGYMKCNTAIGFLDTSAPELAIDTIIANSESKILPQVKFIYCVCDSSYDAIVSEEGVALAIKTLELLGENNNGEVTHEDF